MHGSAAPYDDKLPMLAVDGNKRNVINFGGTVSNQVTINPIDGKKGIHWDPNPSPSFPQDLLLPVSPLSKLPVRLGPQVGVNLKGLRISIAVKTAHLLSAHI